MVRAQSGALGRSSAHHRTRLSFRELAAGFLTAFASDFRKILSRFLVHAHTSRQLMYRSPCCVRHLRWRSPAFFAHCSPIVAVSLVSALAMDTWTVIPRPQQSHGMVSPLPGITYPASSRWLVFTVASLPHVALSKFFVMRSLYRKPLTLQDISSFIFERHKLRPNKRMQRTGPCRLTCNPSLPCGPVADPQRSAISQPLARVPARL